MSSLENFRNRMAAYGLLGILLTSVGCSPYKRLFNGRDVSGWHHVLDSDWLARSGVMYSDQNPDGRLQGESWLFTAKEYEDFILRLEYRIAEGGNSGVFFRDPIPTRRRARAPDGGKPPPWEAGYEVNINNDHEVYPTGSVWATAPGPAKLQREGEWNSLKIKVQGKRISTWVNGQPAVIDFELPERSRRGGIGLQRHGGPAYRDKRIEFRRIEIREL